MSKISDANKRDYADKKFNEARQSGKIVKNFMDGESYTCDPLTTLKLVTASSIYGEPSYYRNSGMKAKDGVYHEDALVNKYSVFPLWMKGKTTTQIMEQAIDEALSYDFEATLNWAVTLRNDFYMRLNPQVIMVRASQHPGRKDFTEKNPGKFDAINQKVMFRADDPLSQLSYYIFKNGGKANMPSILKRSIATKLSKLTPYEVAKYKNADMGIQNAVFLTHAFSAPIDELVKTGTVAIDDSQKTWENLRSEGKSWKEIFNTVNMGHMALLRNLRGVFTEVDDLDFCKKYLDRLKKGVEKGKQFPFRYWSAYQAVSSSYDVHHKSVILDALEECMDISMKNLPHIKGKTAVLSDNSGSAWGAIPSEYGTVKIAEIDNLSATIMACRSDEGVIIPFGDKIIPIPASKRNGILSQVKEVNKQGHNVGESTECGVWTFLDDAITNNVWYDNIIIFSDMQAGHGDLYGYDDNIKKKGFCALGKSSFGIGYINVMDLINAYRNKVNPKVNVMCVQTAGYNNVVVPENIYRGVISYGWTGKEAILLDKVTKIWDETENQLNS